VFTGREWDAETQTYFFRARYYGAGIGRFLSRDGRGFVEGPNDVQYARSQPSWGTDPFGAQMELSGVVGSTASRPLTTSATKMPLGSRPGGEIGWFTASSQTNCAGVSLCHPNYAINIPNVGPNLSLLASEGFVPLGCIKVDCAGVDVNSTRCEKGEREIILFIWEFWTTSLNTRTSIVNTNFHMIGRTIDKLPKAWESKMDVRERVSDIRDPWASLDNSYYYVRNEKLQVEESCFCCDCAKVETVNSATVPRYAGGMPSERIPMVVVGP
jgi:RHS repeat-associated protein